MQCKNRSGKISNSEFITWHRKCTQPYTVMILLYSDLQCGYGRCYCWNMTINTEQHFNETVIIQFQKVSCGFSFDFEESSVFRCECESNCVAFKIALQIWMKNEAQNEMSCINFRDGWNKRRQMNKAFEQLLLHQIRINAEIFYEKSWALYNKEC